MRPLRVRATWNQRGRATPCHSTPPRSAATRISATVSACGSPTPTWGNDRLTNARRSDSRTRTVSVNGETFQLLNPHTFGHRVRSLPNFRIDRDAFAAKALGVRALGFARADDALGARHGRAVLERAQLALEVALECVGVAQRVDVERTEEVADDPAVHPDLGDVGGR